MSKTREWLWWVTVLLVALASGCTHGEVVPLAGRWTCVYERPDGSRSEPQERDVPYNLLADPRREGPWRALECERPLPARSLATWRTPAILLGPLGEHRRARLMGWLDEMAIVGSDEPPGLLLPQPLPWKRDRDGDPILRLRLEREHGAIIAAGDPSSWLLGDERDLFGRLLQITLPDLAMAIVLGLAGVAAIAGAWRLRRGERDLAIRFVLIAAFGVATCVWRLNSNPIFGATRSVWLMVVGSLGTILLLNELLRRHLGLRLGWYFKMLFALTAGCIVLRIPMVATGWLLDLWNLTNLPGYVQLFGLSWLAVLAYRRRGPGDRAVALGVAAIMLGSASRLASTSGLPSVPDMLTAGIYALSVATLVGSAQAMAARHERAQRARLLGRYVPAQLVDQVLDGTGPPNEERRELTVFFSDLHGFTGLSDRLELTALSNVLRTYLSTMATIAERHGATIDKYIGDALMVFFGAPGAVSPAEGARRCVAMAVEMQSAMPSLNETLRAAGLPEPFVVRMGIYTGVVSVGEFGSEQRADYTVIGSAVNLAQRLEQACPLGKILVSDRTRELLDGRFECAPHDPIVPKGYDRAVVVWLIDPSHRPA